MDRDLVAIFIVGHGANVSLECPPRDTRELSVYSLKTKDESPAIGVLFKENTAAPK